MSEEDYQRIVNEVAEDLGVSTDNVIMPDYKLRALYDGLSEEEFRNRIRTVLSMLDD